MFLPNLAVLTLDHASFEPLSSLRWVCGFLSHFRFCKALAVSLGWPLALAVAFGKALAFATGLFSGSLCHEPIAKGHLLQT